MVVDAGGGGWSAGGVLGGSEFSGLSPDDSPEPDDEDAGGLESSEPSFAPSSQTDLFSGS